MGGARPASLAAPPSTPASSLAPASPTLGAPSAPEAAGASVEGMASVVAVASAAVSALGPSGPASAAGASTGTSAVASAAPAPASLVPGAAGGGTSTRAQVELPTQPPAGQALVHTPRGNAAPHGALSPHRQKRPGAHCASMSHKVPAALAETETNPGCSRERLPAAPSATTDTS
jgi:hypothetical protein